MISEMMATPQERGGGIDVRAGGFGDMPTAVHEVMKYVGRRSPSPDIRTQGAC